MNELFNEIYNIKNQHQYMSNCKTSLPKGIHLINKRYIMINYFPKINNNFILKRLILVTIFKYNLATKTNTCHNI